MASDSVEIFQQHKVVPDMLKTAPPTILKVSYKKGIEVNNGEELTPTQVKSRPSIEWAAEDSAFYALIMSDPDAPSRQSPKFREYLHWAVVNIPGNDIDKGEELCAYVGSGPPKDTGLHRYVFLLFKQPSKLTFKEPKVPKNSGSNCPKFNVQNFADKYKLGDPIADNIYQAQWDDYVPTVHKQLSGK